jgi:16S rRNA (cytosine967-C5)-methyltransferase
VPEPRAAATGSDPREIAWRVLRAVDEDGAYANLALPKLLTARPVSPRDAALATELSAGTLRMRGLYDAVLTAATGRPVERLDPPLLDVLRLGVHQLLATRVPAHAAVTTSVQLTRRVIGHRPTGLVNAVLRRVAGHDQAAWVHRVAPSAVNDPLGHLSVALSHPRWVVEQMHAALDDDLEQTSELLAADNQAAQVSLVARPGLATVEELTGPGSRPGRWSSYAVTMGGGDPGRIPAVREGRAGVQDEGSQLVALAAVAAEVHGPDATWLDLTAGPGGKAALLAAVGAGRGARLVATELHPHRARLVAQAVRGVAGTAVLTADATRLPLRDGAFDRVLLDAPCTGLGALRRRPEARWRRTPDELPPLTGLQRDLLHAAMTAVRPGGVVTYATCSPVPAETRDVVQRVSAERTDVELLDASAGLPQLTGTVQPGPYVQLWPHRHGTDAMFIAQLRRR